MAQEWATGDGTPHYHAAGDTYEVVSQAYLRSSTQVALNALALILSE